MLTRSQALKVARMNRQLGIEDSEGGCFGTFNLRQSGMDTRPKKSGRSKKKSDGIYIVRIRNKVTQETRAVVMQKGERVERGWERVKAK